MEAAVVLITYQQQQYVSEAIESLLNQTQLPDQIVVSDDGSTDGTQEIIQKYADQYPNIFELNFSNENYGIPTNLNQGLQMVTADVVTFLAGDDIFRPKKLEKEIESIKQSDADLVYSNFAYVDEDRSELEIWVDERPPTGDVLLECLSRDWPDNTLCRNIMVSYDLLQKSGFYDESFQTYEDWDLKVRLSATTEVEYVDCVLSEYRQGVGGVSTLPWSHHAEMFKKMLSKHDGLISDLPSKDRQYVYRCLNSKLYKFLSFENMKNGNKIKSLYYYILSIILDKEQAFELSDHLRLILPENVFIALSRAKQFIQTNL